MFERFNQRYKVTSRLLAGTSGPVITSPLENTPGYEVFLREYAGATFNNGVYRIHALDERAKWNRLIKAAFPDYKGQFSSFGSDWSGCLLALDSERRENEQPLVMLFEPGTGQALEVPCDFYELHENELVEQSDAAVGDVAFADWLREGNPAPGPTECIGYKVPLFLGGVDQFENYELMDMESYWSIIAQLLDRTRDLPDGTPIGKITLE